MKSIFAAFVVLTLFFSLSCGQVEAQQAGAPSGSNYVPQHGHNGPLDGGKLSVPTFEAYVYGGNQIVTSATFTLVNFATGSKFDTNNWFNMATYKFMPTMPGSYFLIGAVCAQGATTMTQIKLQFAWFGSLQGAPMTWNGNNGAGVLQCVNAQRLFTGVSNGDDLELYISVTGTGALTISSAELGGYQISR